MGVDVGEWTKNGTKLCPKFWREVAASPRVLTALIAPIMLPSSSSIGISSDVSVLHLWTTLTFFPFLM